MKKLILLFIPTYFLFITNSCNHRTNNNHEGYSHIFLMADSLRYSDPVKSDSLYRIILKENNSDDNLPYVSALIGLSLVKTDQGIYDSALVLLEQASEMVFDIKDSSLMLEYYLAEGFFNTEKTEVEKSEKSYEAGLQIAQKLKDNQHIHIFRLNLGQTLIDKGNYAEATRVLNEELIHAEKTGFQAHVAVCLKNLADVAYLTGEYEEAIATAKRTTDIFNRLNMLREASGQLMNMGIYYRALGHEDSALLAYRQAYSGKELMKDSSGMIRIKYNIANLLISNQKYGEAENELDKVYNYCRKNEISNGLIYALSALADVYFETGRPEKSFAALDTALNYAIRNNMLYDQKTFYAMRHLKFAKTRQYEKAYLALLEERKISDSLLSIEKQKEILNLETHYKTRQKEDENQLLKKDNQVKQTRLLLLGFIIVAGTFLFTIVVGIFIMRQRKMKHNQQITLERNTRLEVENRERKTELEKKELEALLKEEQIEKLSLKSELKEQELVFQALARAELKQILDSVQEKLAPMSTRFLRKKDHDEFMNIISELSRVSKKDPLSEFEILFKNLHPGFYEKLLAVNPALTKTELLISAMIRLNLSSKDISRLFNLSITSVEATRSHIRKKLNMDAKESLGTFLITI